MSPCRQTTITVINNSLSRSDTDFALDILQSRAKGPGSQGNTHTPARTGIHTSQPGEHKAKCQPAHLPFEPKSLGGVPHGIHPNRTSKPPSCVPQTPFRPRL
ncbi:hypothetical protein DdX_12671 [Ditylenchus destructor]|uniref:Uncharacterized protein n=1 Tax=Ditylenchus destructor TaxID=166010 RepID=A0AAD4N0B8_9BILA|nr:hypothetical protein DdX_12671 [Ditylenchus destructor]